MALIATAIAVAAATPAAAAPRSYEMPVVLPGDASASSVRADPGTWLISARASDEARATARRYGARAIGPRAIGSFVVARERARALAGALRAHGLLVSAYPNVERESRQAPPGADPFTPREWWRNAVVAPTTPTPPVAPTSPLLGLVDTMPDMTLPEWAGSNFSTLGALPPETVIGHGTATGSVAAAPVNGVGITGIWPGMRALNATLPSAAINCADSVVGITNVIKAGASVINMSYGSNFLCPQEYAVLQYAVAAGIIPVAAAGNEATVGNPLEFPASLPHVLTVGAVTEAGAPAQFSNVNAAVDLGAPGTNVLAAVPVAADTTDGVADGYELLNGTSFAAPIAAAAVTWVRAARPTLTADQISQVVRTSAHDLATPGWDPSTGFGLVNIDSALAAAPPYSDPLEPNDAIVWVDGRGLGKKDPAVFGGKSTRRFEARLDLAEDPYDVYRIVLPARHKVLVSVKPTVGDPDVTVYKSSATTFNQRSRILRKSGHSGSRTDAVTVRNSGRRNRTAYVRVSIHGNAIKFVDYVITIRRR